ncbi:DNA primase/helicase [Acinetobacter phage vB_AbaP_EPab_B]|uniref:Uncharacterized protein n=1 Tax=Acinetobacter phage vB_AbaP_ZHSHW TaxID=2930334 RepID=A0AAE9KRB7_9CAUD|nr:hypothetical protein ZHSHW_14 [Acinetobacter phage vB_AbaP_ZHSHW]WGV35648.1 DNA primase/helicase [Acinetobacter phage vB_AbaP_EPab_B]
MKFGKVKVGMRVRIVSNPNGNRAEPENFGAVGTVSYKEPASYTGKLTVLINLENGIDWVNHKNLEEVKDEA